MNENDEVTKPIVRSRGRMMDFAPRGTVAPRPVVKKAETNLSDNEARRREIARREIARREEIHRQIERQKEQDMIAERRAIAARRDLARRLEVEREENKEALAARERELELMQAREEKARRRAMIEARAIKERQRILAERRAKRARMELERRRDEEERMRPAPVRKVTEPVGSKDPIARKIALDEPVAEPATKPVAEPPKPCLPVLKKPGNKIEHRLGPVDDFEKDLIDEPELADEPEAPEEDTSENNDRFVLGGHSPFINTEVEKRPLSGGNRTIESTAAAVAASRRNAKLPQKPQKFAKPLKRGRYVPYEEPIPHKNIYARTVEKEKDNRNVPTMVVNKTPKGSKATLVIAIILTMILGATVGAIAYLALFQ
jgi:hypothetical protein